MTLCKGLTEGRVPGGGGCISAFAAADSLRSLSVASAVSGSIADASCD